MQPLYDFTAFIANRLSRRLARVIKPTELAISAIYPRADILGMLTKELVADVVYRGEHYYFNYDRLTAVKYFDDMLNLVVGPIPKSITDPMDVAAYIEDRLGIPISITGVNLDNVLVARVNVDDPDYVGQLLVNRENDIGIMPYHFFIESGYNAGTAGTVLADNFNQVQFGGKGWLSGKAQWNALGVELAFSANCTLWVELIANDIGNYYGNIFATKQESGSAYSLGGLFTLRNINTNQNKPWLYAMYGTRFVAPTSPFLDDTPSKIAIVKSGTTYKVFQDGTLRGSYTTSSAVPAWLYFGSAVQRSKQYFRNLMYHQEALSDSEVIRIMNALN